MTPRINLEELARHESEQAEWKENVADVDEVVAMLCTFAHDWQNLGGGTVVCGVREEKDAQGFPQLPQTGLCANRLQEVENTVLTRSKKKKKPKRG